MNYDKYPIEPEPRFYMDHKTRELYHPRGRFLYPKQHGKCFYCGKELIGRRKSYCSDSHHFLYFSTFTWRGLREIIIKRDRFKCVKCDSQDYLEVDHIIAVVNDGKYFDKENLQTLCHSCHKKKTRVDLKRPEKEKQSTKEEKKKYKILIQYL